jgi:hypothetical protein
VAITKHTMTDEQRKSVALEYLKAFDHAGVTSTGGSILDLFAEDAQVFFPKWGLATGKKQIGQLFTDFGGLIKNILHDYATFNWIMTGTDVFACEGTSAGEHVDGSWRAGVTHAGRWCDVFEIRDSLIQRCFIYLDPDYAGLDTKRYPWLSANGRDPSKPMGSTVDSRQSTVDSRSAQLPESGSLAEKRRAPKVRGTGRGARQTKK